MNNHLITPQQEPSVPGLQHERTALAWERTSIAMIVAGVLLARYASTDAHWTIALIGLTHTMVGAGVLVWAGYHYDDLHGPIKRSEVVHPTAARLMGLTTITLTGAGLILAVILILAP